jgi:RES domain-containing protein
VACYDAMLLWRICPRAECPRAFEGTETPGRWNEAGTRLVYASESRALAALEYLAHAEDGEEGTELVAIGGALPDGVSLERVAAEELPPGWDAPEHPPACSASVPLGPRRRARRCSPSRPRSCRETATCS